jgi:hypothetical protein
MDRHLFGDWGTQLFDTTYTPIKEFILDSLLSAGTRKEWNISNTRGLSALQGRDSLYKCTSSSNIDFPTSVLIWHIATDMCYYYCGENASSDEAKKHVMASRKLSNYVMYLVFKCGVMLTSNSQLVHDSVHGEIRDVLPDNPVNLSEKDAVMSVFRPTDEAEKSQ